MRCPPRPHGALGSLPEPPASLWVNRLTEGVLRFREASSESRDVGSTEGALRKGRRGGGAGGALCLSSRSGPPSRHCLGCRGDSREASGREPPGLGSGGARSLETPLPFGSLAHSCAPPATELGVLGGRPPVPWPQRQSGGLPVALIAAGGAEQAGGVCRPEEPGDGREKGL